MENEKIIYTEVYTVLTKLPKLYIDKIPKKVKEEIFNKAETDYSYEIDELQPESKAFILEIIKNYFGDIDVNKKINEYINFCEEKKIKPNNNTIYNPNELFKNRKKSIQSEEEMHVEQTALVEYKEKNILQKLFDKIKSLFIKK